MSTSGETAHSTKPGTKPMALTTKFTTEFGRRIRLSPMAWVIISSTNQIAPRPTSVQNGNRSRRKARAQVLATWADIGMPQNRKPPRPVRVQMLCRLAPVPNRSFTMVALAPSSCIQLIRKSPMLRVLLNCTAQP